MSVRRLGRDEARQLAVRAQLDGYRIARAFGKLDEAAVAMLESSVISEWWRGSSGWPNRRAVLRGSAFADLPAIVDGWLDWEVAHLTA